MKNSFKLLLDVNWFNKKEILNDNILVVSKPKPMGLKWYKLILYYLSFKKFFKSDITGWRYNVKFI